MNVWIEINPLIQTERTGIANFLHFWLRALLAQAPHHRFTLWSPELRDNPFPEFANARFQGRRAFPRWSRMDYDTLWKHTRWCALPTDVDVYHLPFFARPAPRRGRTRLIVTVYDLAFATYPEVLAHRTFFRYLSEVLPEQAEQADKIIAISQSTARDVHTILGVPESKIEVIYPGNDLSLSPDADPLTMPLRADLQAKLPPRYLLYTGTWEPRKNLPVLFRALKKIAVRCREQDVKLVLAGARGWKYQEAEKLLQTLGLEEHVVRLGYVPREALPTLFARALGFVYPSLYEGFGLPVLEAMACGAPVVTSNVSSLPEVVGEAALLIDPHDEGELAGAMERLLDDAALRDELKRRGLAQAQKFSWEENARATLALYHEVV